MRAKGKLIIFCLEFDNNSKLLQSNIDLVRAFAPHCDNILVVATHLGVIPEDLSGFQFIELGGGTTRGRILAIARLLRLILLILFRWRKSWIFHHMSHRTAIFPGIVLKVFRFKQLLWYSHHSAPSSLRIAVKFVNEIVTPSKFSFPLSTRKVQVVGQAVDSSIIPVNFRESRYRQTTRVLSVGRISEAKEIEKFLNLVQKIERSEKLSLILLGETQNLSYLEGISKALNLMGGEVEVHGAVNRKEALHYMTNYGLYFSGTPKGVDRALIEAAMSGCLILTDNAGALELTGMDTILKEGGVRNFQDISQQYVYLSSLSPRQRRNLGVKVSQTARKTSDVHYAVSKILSLYRLE